MKLDVKKFDFNRWLEELKRTNPNDPGSWPVYLKVAAGVVLCAAIVGAVVYFDTLPQSEELKKVEKKEDELRQTFELKQQKAAKLNAYKKQLAEMEVSFGAMLRQLPGRTEVENLLDDISHTGLASGLEFSLFKPQAENKKEFYAELPISLQVSGGYHEFGAFASGVAALPRIVTLHDIVIVKGADGKLTLDATAKTYRYLDEEGGR